MTADVRCQEHAQATGSICVYLLVVSLVPLLNKHIMQEEVESWVWVLFNEPGGVNAYSKEWETGGFSYYEM